MRTFSHVRFFFLFLVLGFLLSFAVTGCSDKDDRDYSFYPSPGPSPTASPEPSPVPDPSPEPSASPVPTGMISYLFKLDGDTAQKVSADASEAAVTAYDADGHELDGASLAESSVAAMTREGDYYVAEANVPKTAGLLAFTFTDGEDVTGVYAIGLSDGVDRYYMSYADLVSEPVLTVCADAGHKTERTAFQVGEDIYPEAAVRTKGGLSVPVSSVVPVDTEVVSYTEGSEGQEASYKAAGEGRTAFTVAYAEAEAEAAAVVTVSAVPLEPAWILPEGYELKDGKIYRGETEMGDPSEIDGKINVNAGGNFSCRIIAADGDSAYKLTDAEVSAEIDSETADHFSAEGGAGELTVSVSAEAEEGETAAVTCAAAGYEVRNSLEVSVLALRSITVYVPSNPYPAYWQGAPEELTFTNLIRLAALDGSGNALPGASLAEEDIFKLKTVTRDGIPCWELKAEVPVRADTLLLLYDITVRSSSPQFDYFNYEDVCPYFAFKPTDSQDSYVLEFEDWFEKSAGNFGTCRDAAFTSPTILFNSGDQVYFNPQMTNRNGITVTASDVFPEDTNVINADFKAVGSGETWFNGSWYGFKGAVWNDLLERVYVDDSPMI